MSRPSSKPRGVPAYLLVMVLALLATFVWGAVYIVRHPDPTGHMRRSPYGNGDPRAEHVIDSIASTIDTDSLYRVYRSMLTAPHPEEVWPLEDCLGRKLMWRYGMYPADRAMQRMRDTLWAGVEAQERAAEARVAPSGMVTSNDSLCAPFGPRGPLIVDGVPLDPSAVDPTRAVPRGSRRP